MIGLDTTVIIDVFKGVPAAKKAIESLRAPFSATRQSYLELMFGIDPKKHQEEEGFYDRLFSSLVTLEIDAGACKRASRLFWGLRRKGKQVDEAVCVIAGIFLTNGVTTIVTRNKKHFERIPGLKVISY